LLNQAGFLDAELMTETGFNSSPKTKGVLFRARKPMVHAIKPQSTGKGRKHSSLNESETVSASKLSTLGDIVDRAIAMGANKAKVIDTDSIVIEKWVNWKCVYGCPMYGKDGYHPPMTPGIDEVKEVIKEYAKAILLNGEDGRLMTEVACRLEGEAYHAGYYKAFALTALPAGTEPVAEPGGT
jgi:hypothetical protein